MKFTINIDFRTWFRIAQVGSSIHGDLLKPNDIDITVSIKLPLLTFKKVKTFRIGKYNLILFHGVSLQEYVDEFDMSIIRGSYKTLFTRKLVLSDEAQHSLDRKLIVQRKRDCSLFKVYNLDVALEERDNKKNRYKKYLSKLPEGWEIRSDVLSKRIINSLMETV